MVFNFTNYKREVAYKVTEISVEATNLEEAKKKLIDLVKQGEDVSDPCFENDEIKTVTKGYIENKDQLCGYTISNNDLMRI